MAPSIIQTFWGGLGSHQTCLISDGAPIAGKKVVIHLESASGDWMTGMTSDPAAYTYALKEAGYLIVASRFGANTWGSAAVQTDISSLLTAIGFITGATKYMFLGRSMGGCNVTKYALNNASKVAGLITDSGALDLSLCRGTDGAQGLFYASINTALSVGSDALWNAAKPTADPTLFAASLPTVPQFHSGWATDTFVGGFASTIQNFFNALTAPQKALTTIKSVAGTGHTGSLVPADVVAFANSLTFS